MKTKVLSLALLTTFSYNALASCSELINSGGTKLGEAAELIQDIGNGISAVGTSLTSTGYSTASSNVLIVPGWIIFGSGLVISATGGVIQLTIPQKKAITNVYKLFTEARIGDGTNLDLVKKEIDLAIPNNKLSKAELAQVIIQGDQDERWCPTVSLDEVPLEDRENLVSDTRDKEKLLFNIATVSTIINEIKSDLGR
jgi:hypothetical protein